MKTGRTLQQLADEVERQRDTRRDFVAPTDVMTMEPVEGDVMLALPGHDAFDLIHASPPCQFATALNNDKSRHLNLIPATRDLLRAFLSDSYRPLDNYDLLEAVLPVLARPGLVIMSCEVTETRLYIKVVDEQLIRDVPTGRRMGDGSHTIFDTVSPVAIISNSEVGHGSLKIESGVYTKACTNLAMFSDRALRKYHVGGKQDAIGEGFERFLTDETKQARDLAVWMQVRDVLASAFDEAKFEALIKVFAGSVDDKIEGDPIKVIDLTTKKFGLSEGERGGVLKHLIEGGDLTRYGLHAAITRSAQDHPDYDRATEIERIGGQVIELNRSEWKALAPAE